MSRVIVDGPLAFSSGIIGAKNDFIHQRRRLMGGEFIGLVPDLQASEAMKKIGCIGHDCAACATREKHINKLKQEIERWKSRAATYKKQADKLQAEAKVKP